MLPLVRFPTLFPGQMGVNGSDVSLGLRTAPQGNVFYVDSTHADASDAQDGTSPDHPLATIDHAIGHCVANHHDVIVVGSNHAENIATAAAINCDIAGIRIVGVGTGQDRPHITWTNANATVAIGAANVSIENLLFLVGVDSIVVMIDVNSTDFTLLGCEIREGNALQFLTAIDVNGGGANAADRCKVLGCTIKSEAAGAVQAIEIGAVQDGMEIAGNFITGDFSVGGIHSGSVLTNILVAHNYIRNINAGDFAIELSAAATGMCIGNRLHSDAAATCLDPGSLMCHDNTYTIAIDTAAVPIPAVAAGPLPAGSIDANTVANGTIDAATFAAGAIDAAAIANAAIDAATFAAGAIDAAAIANNAIDYATFAADAKYALHTIEKADGGLVNPTDALFTVAGGPIMVEDFVGIVTTAPNPAGAVTCQIQALVTDPAGAVNLSTAVDLDSDAAGTSYTFTAAAPGVLTPTTAGALAAVPVERWLVPIGTIQGAFSANKGGVIHWYMVYKKLSPLSTVVAAP